MLRSNLSTSLKFVLLKLGVLYNNWVTKVQAVKFTSLIQPHTPLHPPPPTHTHSHLSVNTRTIHIIFVSLKNINYVRSPSPPTSCYVINNHLAFKFIIINCKSGYHYCFVVYMLILFFMNYVIAKTINRRQSFVIVLRLS